MDNDNILDELFRDIGRNEAVLKIAEQLWRKKEKREEQKKRGEQPKMITIYDLLVEKFNVTWRFKSRIQAARAEHDGRAIKQIPEYIITTYKQLDKVTGQYKTSELANLEDEMKFIASRIRTKIAENQSEDGMEIAVFAEENSKEEDEGN